MTDCACTDDAILCADHREPLGLNYATTRAITIHYIALPCGLTDSPDLAVTPIVAGTSCRACLTALNLTEPIT